MSSYTEQKTLITDADILKKCLEEKGYKNIEVHEKPQQLIGYHGDKRQQTAEIIIRRKDISSASNDIGFKKQADGSFNAIISDFDKHRHDEAWMSDLKKRYAEKKIRRVASQHGMTFVKKVETKQGGFQLQFIAA